MNTNPNSETQPTQNLSLDNLTTLYQEQWEQVRHLDSLDFRNMTLLPIVVSILTIGTGYLSKNIQNIPHYVPTFATVIIVGLAFSGCYTTFRNWLCYMRRFSILTALENQMGMVERGVIKQSLQFKPPRDFWTFNLTLLKSIRFPLTALYTALGGCGVMIYNTNTMWQFPIPPIVISIAIFLYCDVITYLSMEKEFREDTKNE